MAEAKEKTDVNRCKITCRTELDTEPGETDSAVEVNCDIGAINLYYVAK
jgi:hypothetical protein